MLFPDLQKNEFFAAGVSYAGKYVPAIGHAIFEDSKRKTSDPNKPKINLKGLAIGNGWTDPINQLNYADFLYQTGLIDFNVHRKFTKIQNEAIECIKKRDFGRASDIVQDLITSGSNTLFQNLTGFDTNTNILQPYDDDGSEKLADRFLQQPEVRRAIHVGNNSFHDDDDKVDEFLTFDILDSVAPWLAKLLSHYKVLVYNGQLDMNVHYPGTVNYLKRLNFSGAQEYKTAERHIWRVGKVIAGYSKNAGNLTELLVRNAGKL